MHTNSLTAYQSLNSAHRREIIAQAYADHGRMTDRELCAILGFRDMNNVRPRVTDMIHDGVLVEVATVKDPLTRRPVRVVSLRTEPQQLEMAI